MMQDETSFVVHSKCFFWQATFIETFLESTTWLWWFRTAMNRLNLYSSVLVIPTTHIVLYYTHNHWFTPTSMYTMMMHNSVSNLEANWQLCTKPQPALVHSLVNLYLHFITACCRFVPCHFYFAAVDNFALMYFSYCKSVWYIVFLWLK